MCTVLSDITFAVDAPPIGGDDLILHGAVMPRHIQAGRPGKCARCPVALAIIEAAERAGIRLLPEDPVKVYGDTVQLVTADGRWYVAAATTAMRQFVPTFDHGDLHKVSPFRFELWFTLAESSRVVA